MEQTSIDEWAKHHARRRDPDTSHAAAREARGLARAHGERIVRALQAAGRPLTAEELGERCGLDAHRVGKRLVDLRRLDRPASERLVDRGDRRRTSSGRDAIAWWLAAWTEPV